MKILTIKEPWATLIANGYKKYEFRTWKTSYRGKILIHAGKGKDVEYIKKFKNLNLKYSPSKIVAVADLVDCIELSESNYKQISKDNSNIYNSNTKTGYAWKLENIEKINSKKDIKGKLGLWNYNEEI